MSDAPIDSYAAALAFALTLPGTEPGTSYGKPTVKIAANGRAFVHVGHEPDSSFVLELDRDVIEFLMETEPETYWQTPHYAGWGAVLVRFDSPDPARVRAMIVAAHERAAARKPAKPRKPRKPASKRA